MFYLTQAPVTRHWAQRILIAGAVSVALVTSACGSDEAATAAVDDSTVETEPEAVATTTADEPSEPEPEGSETEASPEDLIGTWSGPGGITWQIEGESIVVTGGPGDGIEQSYSATSTTLEMVDLSGPRACPRSQVGNYEWTIDDDVLTLTLISDPCGGRGGFLDGYMVTRQ